MRFKYFSAPQRSLNDASAKLPRDAEMLRAYLRLSPTADGPIHARNIDFCFRQLNSDGPLYPVQVNPSGRLRRTIASETGVAAFAVEWPADLPGELWTARWHEFVVAVQDFATLSTQSQVRVVALLGSLGMYRAVLRLVPARAVTEDTDTAASVLESKRALAEYKLKARTRGASEVDLELCAVLATRSPDLHVRLGAALSLVVLYARGGSQNGREVARWCEVAGRHYEDLHPDAAWIDCLYASTYWRAVSFWPYMRGDREQTLRELATAEEFALRVAGDTSASALAEQNLHPLLETCTKAALWSGDHDLALSYAGRLAQHDPFDPKVHLGLGDVLLDVGRTEEALSCYRSAERLGAPYRAFAAYVVGECLERLDALEEACDAYLRALSVDPNGVSALMRAHAVSARLGWTSIERWAALQLAQSAGVVARLVANDVRRNERARGGKVA
jgi:tetratricopeptide (TPR) repeat protein